MSFPKSFRRELPAAIADFDRSFNQSKPWYATATFKALNVYAGWSNVKYVLNDVKNPIRRLKIAGPLGLGICAVLYLLANVAYFAYVAVMIVTSTQHAYCFMCRAATQEEIKTSGVTVAALFFKNVFGTRAEQALAVIVALR